jgi:hypothetical protein
MASNLAGFLQDVANDPAKLGQFRQAPDATMNAAGLTPDQQAVLKSKDPQKIRQAVITELGITPAADTVVVIILLA